MVAHKGIVARIKDNFMRALSMKESPIWARDGQADPEDDSAVLHFKVLESSFHFGMALHR